MIYITYLVEAIQSTFAQQPKALSKSLEAVLLVLLPFHEYTPAPFCSHGAGRLLANSKHPCSRKASPGCTLGSQLKQEMQISAELDMERSLFFLPSSSLHFDDGALQEAHQRR